MVANVYIRLQVLIAWGYVVIERINLGPLFFYTISITLQVFT